MYLTVKSCPFLSRPHLTSRALHSIVFLQVCFESCSFSCHSPGGLPKSPGFLGAPPQGGPAILIRAIRESLRQIKVVDVSLTLGVLGLHFQKLKETHPSRGQ